MGFEASYDFFKGFVLKKQYQTSAMPLYMKARRVIAQETGCITEVSDNVVSSGYSEVSTRHYGMQTVELSRSIP